MSRVFVSGLGAVSPAGWGVECLRRAVNDGYTASPQLVERPGWNQPLQTLRVPPPNPRPAWAAHPRLRRSAAISQFAMGAAAEALGESHDGPLGIIFCTTCGGVNYSRRFYDEVLREPATASPLLFPETVFNAPASHLSAVLGSAAANYTLVGDSGVFLHGLALAADWLADGHAERCLVVAAEEADWIIADVLRHFRKAARLSEGAGALLLTREATASTRAELECVTHPEPCTGGKRDRQAALEKIRAALPSGPVARAEVAQLGEGFSASTAWQAIAAISAAREKNLPRAAVRAPGSYQEAVGASFLAVANPG